MKVYNQKFHILAVSESDSNKKIQAVVDSILKLKQPVLINSYSTKSTPSEQFIKLFQERLINRKMLFTLKKENYLDI